MFGRRKNRGRTSSDAAATTKPERKARPKPEGELRRLHLHYVGQVQGVGFRWTAQRAARELGLTGWVYNEYDGSVSMELQGTDGQISEFFGAFDHQFRRYPIRYTIDEKEDIAPDPSETDFSVRF